MSENVKVVFGRVEVTGTTAWHLPSATAAALGMTPPCHPQMPCGCYGCGVCNGSQAPMYSATATPGCTRYNPCAKHDCQKCFPGNILPPDMRGRLKPGGPTARPVVREKGYRVLPYGDWLNAEEGSREGEVFSTPDLANRRARRGAKEGKETWLVLREGARWKLLKAGGDEVVIG